MFIWIGEHGQRLERARREGEQRLDEVDAEEQRHRAGAAAPRSRTAMAKATERRAGDARQDGEIAGAKAAAGDRAERDRAGHDEEAGQPRLDDAGRAAAWRSRPARR